MDDKLRFALVVILGIATLVHTGKVLVVAAELSQVAPAEVAG